MLRNESIPGVHWEHAYDHGDVKLPTALPWMHELGWPFTTVPLLLATELYIAIYSLRLALVINSLEVAFNRVCCQEIFVIQSLAA